MKHKKNMFFHTKTHIAYWIFDVEHSNLDKLQLFICRTKKNQSSSHPSRQSCHCRWSVWRCIDDCSTVDGSEILISPPSVTTEYTIAFSSISYSHMHLLQHNGKYKEEAFARPPTIIVSNGKIAVASTFACTAVWMCMAHKSKWLNVSCCHCPCPNQAARDICCFNQTGDRRFHALKHGAWSIAPKRNDRPTNSCLLSNADTHQHHTCAHYIQHVHDDNS